MTSTTTVASVRLRRLLPAVLFAAAVTVGAGAPIASAERSLDIGAYDDCLARMWRNNPNESDGYYREYIRLCCIDSGGVWDDAEPDMTSACKAPPAEDVERPLPPRMFPGAETSAPLEPAPVTPPTFQPGPAKQGS